MVTVARGTVGLNFTARIKSELLVTSEQSPSMDTYFSPSFLLPYILGTFIFVYPC